MPLWKRRTRRFAEMTRERRSSYVKEKKKVWRMEGEMPRERHRKRNSEAESMALRKVME